MIGKLIKYIQQHLPFQFCLTQLFMSLWVICNQSGFEKLQIRCVINYSVGGTIKIFLIHNSSTAPIHHTTFAPIVDKFIIPGQFLHKIHPYFPLFKEGSVLTSDQHGTSIPIKMFLPRICHPSLHNLHGPACPWASTWVPACAGQSVSTKGRH